MSGSMDIKDIPFFNEIKIEELTSICGGVYVPLPNRNKIEKGRGIVTVDLRGILKTEQKEYTGSFQNCTVEGEDFNGDVKITCQLNVDLLEARQGT